MHAKTEEFLNVLFWSATVLSRPSFRNLTDSYETWAYRNGLLRQIQALEKRKWIERNKTAAPDDRVYRLTAQGRLQVLGGRDPQERWAREWDGHWRLVLFEIPTGHDAQRLRLYRYLRDKGYGHLQKSVWITPDPLEEENAILAGGKINAGTLALFKGQPCGEESDVELAGRAWDFAEINRRYAHHLKILDARPAGALDNEKAALALQDWAGKEREAWQKAMIADPLLPERILPADYLGKKSWSRRMEVLSESGRLLQTFKL